MKLDIRSIACHGCGADAVSWWIFDEFLCHPCFGMFLDLAGKKLKGDDAIVLVAKRIQGQLA